MFFLIVIFFLTKSKVVLADPKKTIKNSPGIISFNINLWIIILFYSVRKPQIPYNNLCSCVPSIKVEK